MGLKGFIWGGDPVTDRTKSVSVKTGLCLWSRKRGLVPISILTSCLSQDEIGHVGLSLALSWGQDRNKAPSVETVVFGRIWAHIERHLVPFI